MTADSDDLDRIEWPAPFKTSERLPEAARLVLAWKPIIVGWDIVPGRQVVEQPEVYTHWLPMMPRPE